MNAMHIVTTVNDKWAIHAAVLFVSILANKTSPVPVQLYVIDGGISDANKKRLSRAVSKYGGSVQLLSIDQSIYEGFKTVVHLTKETYYRYSIPYLLDNDVEKVLYLDADIVVKGDIGELWETDISSYYVAAVDDPGVDTMRHADLSVPESYGHFNAGVLLMNLTKWRECDLFHKLIDFIRNHPDKIMWPSQDPLNALLYDKRLSLPPKWNYMSSTHRDCPRVIEPVVIHFNEGSKPWDNGHPLQAEYFRYALTIRREWDETEDTPFTPELDGAITIVTSADNRFAYPLAVMLNSLLENKKSLLPVEIYTIDGGITVENKRKLCQSVERYGVSIRYLAVRSSIIRAFAHWGDDANKFYRIFIPDMLKRTCTKALYLDGDLIVTEDITSLWEIDIDGYYLAAVEDSGDSGLSRPRREVLELPPDCGYFNSGVMLLNLPKWRQADVSGMLFTYVLEPPVELELFEQDAMNAFLHKSWLKIDPKWNYTTGMSMKFPLNAAVIHYTGYDKPWLKDGPRQHTRKDEFARYAALTPWN